MTEVNQGNIQTLEEKTKTMMDFIDKTNTDINLDTTLESLKSLITKYGDVNSIEETLRDNVKSMPDNDLTSILNEFKNKKNKLDSIITDTLKNTTYDTDEKRVNEIKSQTGHPLEIKYIKKQLLIDTSFLPDYRDNIQAKKERLDTLFNTQPQPQAGGRRSRRRRSRKSKATRKNKKLTRRTRRK